MSSRLTEELATLGFLCGIEMIVYSQNTGAYTMLIIEGSHAENESLYRYDFYKQTFYPHGSNKITVYGEKLTAPQLLRRVKQYLSNRERYLNNRKTTETEE
ncbi:hypothetical protein QN079_15895 [Enterococcus sp. FZMF]|nr:MULTISPECIES: hypothetical protein [unclassified Enterococcus]MDO0919931.1 hypothetical protein [Enterococcus sp. B1E2]WIV15402.1 hypothetical protein QN079_15895 [Enterococcus sp. FZMF]